MLTLLSKGVPTKLLKLFWLKIFFICHRCQRHQWSTLSCEYLRDFWKKFEMVLMGYSGAGGKLILKKTRSKKSRDTVPLKPLLALSWPLNGVGHSSGIYLLSPLAASIVTFITSTTSTFLASQSIMTASTILWRPRTQGKFPNASSLLTDASSLLTELSSYRFLDY